MEKDVVFFFQLTPSHESTSRLHLKLPFISVENPSELTGNEFGREIFARSSVPSPPPPPLPPLPPPLPPHCPSMNPGIDQ